LEKVIESMGEYIDGFKLYMEDIEDIYDVLSKINDDEIIVIVNSFKLSNIEELKNNKFSKITQLEIKRYKPYFSIKFNKTNLFLYSGENNTYNIGVYEKIKSIINNRRYNLIMNIKKMISTLSWMLFGAFTTVLFTKKSINTNDIVFSILLLSFCVFDIVFLSKNKGYIYNTYSSDKPNFLTRQKDYLICLVIGAFITILVQVILKRLGII
jgi:hypothetical protein